MNFYITAFPIDRKFQEVINIYSTGIVPDDSVGFVIKQLVREGYHEANVYFDKECNQFNMHFVK